MTKRVIACLCMLLVLTLNTTGCGSQTGEAEQINIAVVVKSTTSNFWKTAEGGVNTAASEYNVAFTFEGPDNEEDSDTQIEEIQKAIDDKVDAIVLSAIDNKKTVEVVEKAKKQGIHIVVIDSGVDTDSVDAEISTDNYASGEMAAEAVLKNPAEKLQIGIVNFDQGSENGQLRQAGFEDTISKDERVTIVNSVNVDSNITAANAGTKQMLEENPQINVLVTFNEWTTLGVGYAIQELELQNQIQVVGFDNNIVSIGMLETGEMDALIVQNPFAMGYLGIETAYNLIKHNSIESMISTDTTLVTADNMYDSAIQKVLFPLDNSKTK